MGARAQLVAERDEVLIAGPHQRQRHAEARLVDKRRRRQGGVPVPDPERHRVIGDVVAAAREQERVPGAAGGAAIGEVLREQDALLDAEHESDLVAGIGEVEDRHAELGLETRDDAPGKHERGIVEPRIPLGHDLERHEGRRLRRRGHALLAGLCGGRQGAALLHDRHGRLVVADAAVELRFRALVALVPLAGDRFGRGRLGYGAPGGAEGEGRLFRAGQRLRLFKRDRSRVGRCYLRRGGTRLSRGLAAQAGLRGLPRLPDGVFAMVPPLARYRGPSRNGQKHRVATIRCRPAASVNGRAAHPRLTTGREARPSLRRIRPGPFDERAGNAGEHRPLPKRH